MAQKLFQAMVVVLVIGYIAQATQLHPFCHTIPANIHRNFFLGLKDVLNNTFTNLILKWILNNKLLSNIHSLQLKQKFIGIKCAVLIL